MTSAEITVLFKARWLASSSWYVWVASRRGKAEGSGAGAPMPPPTLLVFSACWVDRNVTDGWGTSETGCFSVITFNVRASIFFCVVFLWSRCSVECCVQDDGTIDHRLHGSASTVNGDRPSQWQMANIWPPQNRNPWADCNKIRHN